MTRALLLSTLLLIAGCKGYIVDHLNGKAVVLRPQLARYGLAESGCVASRLEAGLTVWQSRQLASLAARLEGGDASSTFGAREFRYIAGLVEDPAVGRVVDETLAACGVARAEAVPAVIATNLRELPPPSEANPAAAPAPAATALWVNLGAARSGQGIAVDAASVSRDASWRQAWFRLLNGGGAGEADLGYLLRVDCGARTITAYAGRRYAADGSLAEQKDYEAPEGPLPIEPGTVMDVAFQSLCQGPL